MLVCIINSKKYARLVFCSTHFEKSCISTSPCPIVLWSGTALEKDRPSDFVGY